MHLTDGNTMKDRGKRYNLDLYTEWRLGTYLEEREQQPTDPSSSFSSQF